MRILIIAGHFSPEVGYLEVYLARAMARLGHKVKVLSTTTISNSVEKAIGKKNYNSGTMDFDGYEVERLKPVFKFRTMLFVTGVKARIMKFKPDALIAIGVAKFMPLLGAFYKGKSDYKLISIFGDNSFYRSTPNGLIGRLESHLMKFGFLTFKKWWYLYTFRRSDKIVTTTPETEDILLSLFPSRNDKIKNKIQFIPLGFDDQEFYLDMNEGKKIRSQYGILDNELVIVTATKMAPYKNIELFIDTVHQLIKEGLSLHLFLIGFGDDAYSNSLRRIIASQKLDHHIHCEPFLAHDRLRAYYNAADLGLWSSPTITIQEAAGTGLTLLLPLTKVYSHLITESITGYFYVKEEELREKIRNFYGQYFYTRDESQKIKERVARLNLRFSYRVLVDKLLNLVEQKGDS